MKTEPVNYNNPLGISKREWTRLLGANLALLLLVYAVAIVCTLFGSDFFILNAINKNLEEIETTLRSIHLYPLVQMAFATIEETLVLMYVMKSKPRWWWPVCYFCIYYGLALIFGATLGYFPSFVTVLFGVLFASVVIAINCLKAKKKPWVMVARLAIAIAITFGLNAIIAFFRTRYIGFYKGYTNAQIFYLSVEYDLALGLALGFITMLIPWEKGEQRCPTFQTSRPAGGSSPTTKAKLPKSSPKRINLTPKQRRRIAFLRAKVMTIQTVALAFIAFVPIFAGNGTEFALMYVAFCLTRLILGFSHSLHFKSELSCVTIGGLVFWGLTYLLPNVTVSIIVSLVYGCALALGFRLYWELHDLMMYRKAAKTDRYAMLFVAFDGNLDPRYIKGIMRMNGYADDGEIRMIQMYMAREKIEYIAEYRNEPPRSVDRRLTEIAEDLYGKR